MIPQSPNGVCPDDLFSLESSRFLFYLPWKFYESNTGVKVEVSIFISLPFYCFNEGSG